MISNNFLLNHVSLSIHLHSLHSTFTTVSPHFLSPSLFSSSYLFLSRIFLAISSGCKMLICQWVLSRFCFLADERRLDLTGTVVLGVGQLLCSSQTVWENGHHRTLLRALVFSSTRFCPLGHEDQGHSDSYPAAVSTELLLLSALSEYVLKRDVYRPY